MVGPEGLNQPLMKKKKPKKASIAYAIRKAFWTIGLFSKTARHAIPKEESPWLLEETLDPEKAFPKESPVFLLSFKKVLRNQ